MELRPELILTAVIKSLGDNVVSAIDPQNAPALQQAQLSIALLEILKSRLPLMYRYDRHDLSRFVELGESLAASDHLAGHGGKQLAAVCEQARDVLDRARADPGEMLDALRDIRHAISQHVDNARSGGDRERVQAIERAVVASAKELTLRERSWTLPFGFESDPTIIPGIEKLLDPVSG